MEDRQDVIRRLDHPGYVWAGLWFCVGRLMNIVLLSRFKTLTVLIVFIGHHHYENMPMQYTRFLKL